MNSYFYLLAKNTTFLMFVILFFSMILVSYAENVKNKQFSDCVNNAIEHKSNVTLCKIILEH